jgi:hypothetical protein
MVSQVKLSKDAHYAANLRGHVMTNFKKIRDNVRESECKNCYMHIWITVNPAPKDTKITGMAVSCICTKNKGDSDDRR